MRHAPYIIVEAAEQRPLTVLHVRVYADRIVSTELGGRAPCTRPRPKPPPRSNADVHERGSHESPRT
jgi:hypothetical protein